MTERGGPSDREAAQWVSQIVLADLGRRLTGDEAQNLADHMGEGVDPAQPGDYVRAVFE